MTTRTGCTQTLLSSDYIFFFHQRNRVFEKKNIQIYSLVSLGSVRSTSRSGSRGGNRRGVYGVRWGGRTVQVDLSGVVEEEIF